MMPFFATLYRESKISIKEIALLTNQEPSEVIDQIAKLIDDIEMDDELIEYSHEIGNKIQPFLLEAKQRGASLKGTIKLPEVQDENQTLP